MVVVEMEMVHLAVEEVNILVHMAVWVVAEMVDNLVVEAVQLLAAMAAYGEVAEEAHLLQMDFLVLDLVMVDNMAVAVVEAALLVEPQYVVMVVCMGEAEDILGHIVLEDWVVLMEVMAEQEIGRCQQTRLPLMEQIHQLGPM